MIRLTVWFCTALSLQAAVNLMQSPPDSSWTPLRGSAVIDDSVRHNNNKSVRLEAIGSPDAGAGSSTVNLTIGKTYEISGWVRTENLVTKDLDRSPIASGAALTMESMPFDVHGVSRRYSRLDTPFPSLCGDSRARSHRPQRGVRRRNAGQSLV